MGEEDEEGVGSGEDNGDSSGNDTPQPGEVRAGEDEDEDREEGVGDDGLDDGVMKIPKPAGEVGRPGRGGYSLDQVLQWPPIRIELLKVSCFCR